MTYRQLLEKIQSLDEETLAQDAIFYEAGTDEYCPLTEFYVVKETDVLDEGHLVFTNRLTDKSTDRLIKFAGKDGLKHLDAWLEREFSEFNRDAAKEAMLVFLNSQDDEDFELWLERGWPRILEASPFKDY